MSRRKMAAIAAVAVVYAGLGLAAVAGTASSAQTSFVAGAPTTRVGIDVVIKVTTIAPEGCPQAANLPDGDDPWGGCFPGPESTGVPDGTSLTAYTGPSTISTPGTIVDSKIIDDCILITAADVIIRNSTITGDCGWTVDGYITTGAGDWFLVEDSEITCGVGAQGGIGERGFIPRRVEIKGECANNVDCDQDCLIEDSYLWDLPFETEVEHGDGIQSCCAANVTIQHNTSIGQSVDGAPTTSAIILPIAVPPTGPILVHRNLLTGGAYTLYCASTTNQTITDNVFGTGARGPSFGHIDNCSFPTTFSGNVTDVGDPVTP